MPRKSPTKNGKGRRTVTVGPSLLQGASIEQLTDEIILLLKARQQEYQGEADRIGDMINGLTLRPERRGATGATRR